MTPKKRPAAAAATGSPKKKDKNLPNVNTFQESLDLTGVQETVIKTYVPREAIPENVGPEKARLDKRAHSLAWHFAVNAAIEQSFSASTAKGEASAFASRVMPAWRQRYFPKYESID